MVRNRIRKTRRAIFASCAIAATLLIFEGIGRTETDAGGRAEALARAEAALDARDYGQAKKLATIAESDSSLKPWALLVKATADEKAGNVASARKLFQAIPETSAAGLNARVGLLRIDLVSNPKKRSLDGKAVSALEQALRRNQRSDLLAELNFLRAQLAYQNGQLELASCLFLNVRRSIPGKPLALQSRERQWRIQERLGKDAPAALIEEAAQLIKENDPEAALQKIAAAKRSLKKGTSSYYEALLSEESAERALGKTADADRLLSEIAAGKDAAAAATAMMKIVKVAWNGNNEERTLQAVKEYRSRFGKSHNDELLYVEGRSLDRLGRKEESDEKFEAIVSDGTDLTFRLRAARQLAWAQYRKGRVDDAAKLFRRGASVAKSELDKSVKDVKDGYAAPPSQQNADDASKRIRKVRDVLDDYLHHRYWLAQSIKHGAEPVDDNELRSILEEIFTIAPHSYYGMLAAQSSGTKLERSDQLAASECLLPLAADKAATLEALERAGLMNFAQAEIESLISNSIRGEESLVELASAGALRATKRELRPLLSRAAWSAQYGEAKLGAMLADSLYKRPAILNPYAEDTRGCGDVLEALAFPRPYPSYFQEAAKAHGVPVSLLYAHARTESFFDPLARSSKDARGLMQMLPSTAAKEGLPAGGDLFDPKVNVFYGAKHLAGLLARYHGRFQFAAAAYNAGANATQNWLDADMPDDPNVWPETISYPETRDYVKKIVLAKLHYEQKQP